MITFITEIVNTHLLSANSAGNHAYTPITDIVTFITDS